MPAAWRRLDVLIAGAGTLPSAAMSAMLAPSAQSHLAECRSPVNDGLIVGE